MNHANVKRHPPVRSDLANLSADQQRKALARFWAKIEKTETCWLWRGPLTPLGYGKFALKGRYRAAHRVAWELCNEPIPEDREIDHLCRTRACVNPSHLDVVTRRENLLRSSNQAAVRARATKCKHGHAFSTENTRIARNGNRQCRRCTELYSRVRNLFVTLRIHNKGPITSIEAINEALDFNEIGRQLRPLLAGFETCDPLLYRQIAKSLYDAYRVGRNENQNNLK